MWSVDPPDERVTSAVTTATHRSISGKIPYSYRHRTTKSDCYKEGWVCSTPYCVRDMCSGCSGRQTVGRAREATQRRPCTLACSSMYTQGEQALTHGLQCGPAPSLLLPPVPVSAHDPRVILHRWVPLLANSLDEVVEPRCSCGGLLHREAQPNRFLAVPSPP